MKVSHLLTCRLCYHSPAQTEKEGLGDLVAHEHGPPRTGLEFMFIFITAPPSMLLGLPHTSACGVCLLSPCTWSLHVVSPLGTARVPMTPTLLAWSLHGDAWGCRGWQAWLCLSIYSEIDPLGTRRADGSETALVLVRFRKLPWDCQGEKYHQTTKTTGQRKVCALL